METTRDLNDSTVKGLQKLCKLCHDSAEGYRTAADQLDNNDVLKHAFLNTAQDRQTARDRLAGFLGTSHEDIPEGGTLLGSAHRWWLDAKAAISSNDSKAVLTEAIRGEKAIEDEFQDVLVDTAGSPANAVLQDQLGSIKACRETLEQVKDARA